MEGEAVQGDKEAIESQSSEEVKAAVSWCVCVSVCVTVSQCVCVCGGDRGAVCDHNNKKGWGVWLYSVHGVTARLGRQCCCELCLWGGSRL